MMVHAADGSVFGQHLLAVARLKQHVRVVVLPVEARRLRLVPMLDRWQMLAGCLVCFPWTKPVI